MTRHRLILLIRCVTLLCLCAFTDFGLYLLASFAWVPLGLFMPVFATTTVSCPYANSGTASQQYQVDTSTFADGSDTACAGQCTSFNGSWIYTFNTGTAGSACNWNEIPVSAITRCSKIIGSGIGQTAGNLRNFQFDLTNANGGTISVFWWDQFINNQVLWKVTGTGSPVNANISSYHLPVVTVDLKNTCTVTGDAIVTAL